MREEGIMNEQTSEQVRYLKEQAEYNHALKCIQVVIQTQAGRDLITYLLKSLDVNEYPVVGMTGDMLMDRMGFLRAGNSIFKLIAAATPDIAGQIVAQIEKERNVYQNV